MKSIKSSPKVKINISPIITIKTMMF